MRLSLKKIFLRILFIANLACIVVLLAGCMAPYVNPAQFWPVALSGILFPIVYILIAAVTVFWFFAKKRNTIINFVALAIAFPGMLTSFPLHFSKRLPLQKTANELRILSWNVGLMNYSEADSTVAIKNNALIFQKLKSSNADVLCLQEFFTAVIPGNHYNLADSISRTLNYPYYYFSRDDGKFDNKFYNGTIIFSRYPMFDTLKRIFPGAYAGSMVKTSLLVNKDTFDLISTRLQSVKFKKEEYKDLHEIKTGAAGSLEGSKNIIGKLKAGYQNRVTQVEMLRSLAHECRHPLIITGDFNDVPMSYAYATTKQNMRNAWQQRGLGFGRTFSLISPTLRIDNIFYSKTLSATAVKRIFTAGETDHHGLVADLEVIH